MHTRKKEGLMKQFFQGTIGYTPKSVPMVSIVFFRDLFLGIITHKYPLYRASIGISHRGTLVGDGRGTSNYPLIFAYNFKKI